MSGDSFQVVAQQHIVTVRVTSSINSFGSERRYPKNIVIGEMKSKLELITGASPATMKLQLQDKDGKPVCPMDNDSAMLGSFPVEDNMIIHVVDKNLRMGEFEDTSKVEKFEISKEDYEKRSDSVRAVKQRMKMGQFAEVDPEEQKRKDEEKREKEQRQKELVATMKLGDRCEVQTKGQMARRGEVVYLGETEFQSGLWVGVKYDEPVGKNDGCVKGKRYFECPPKYGGFVRPEDVKVGDFPEEDLELSDDEM